MMSKKSIRVELTEEELKEAIASYLEENHDDFDNVWGDDNIDVVFHKSYDGDTTAVVTYESED